MRILTFKINILKYLQYTAGLFFLFMKKVFAYIDGFNSCHCLKSAIESQNSKLTNKNKWINYRKLIYLFFDKNTDIDKIMFFSAIPYHAYKDDTNKRTDKINKHNAFYEILNKYCRIEVVNGRFCKKLLQTLVLIVTKKSN